MEHNPLSQLTNSAFYSLQGLTQSEERERGDKFYLQTPTAAG